MKVHSYLQRYIILGIGLCIFFILFLLITNPHLLGYAGASALISILLLVVFGFAYQYFSKSNTAEHMGIIFGLLDGIFFIFNITFENFIALPQPLAGRVTLFFMFCIFLTFATCGFQVTKKNKSFKLGIFSVLISAIVGVVIALLVGFLINLVFPQQLQNNLLHSGEFERSPIKDISLFTVFNTLDSALTHLIEVPIIAVVFGSLGGGIAKFIYK